jgi:hypothetical protein
MQGKTGSTRRRSLSPTNKNRGGSQVVTSPRTPPTSPRSGPDTDDDTGSRNVKRARDDSTSLTQVPKKNRRETPGTLTQGINLRPVSQPQVLSIPVLQPPVRKTPPGKSPARDRELRSDPYILECVQRFNDGRFDDFEEACNDLMTEANTGLGPPELLAARVRLIEAVFASKNLRQRAAERPDLIAGLVACAGRLVTSPQHVPWLRDKLKALDRAPRVAELVLTNEWHDPKVFGADVTAWTVKCLGTDGLNKPTAGLAARMFNILWRSSDHDTMEKLIFDGVDTTQAAVVGFRNPVFHKTEGIHSGFVMPLEHLVAKYVGPAQSPELAAEASDFDKYRLPSAKRVLAALNTRGNTRVLTDFVKVLSCPLVKKFDDAKGQGTIWGFEHIRTPYVQAVHKTTTFGKQPVRMMEIWEAVGQILNEGQFEALLKNPDAEIPKIISTALSRINPKQLHLPPEIGSYDEFVTMFKAQAESYLRYVSTAQPTAKFLTTEKRGSNRGQNLGAFGCRAGLWWSQETGRPIYYVLDGIKMDDVANFKTVKTKFINAHLNDPHEDVYNEVITLVELREILKNWDEMKKVVQFVSMGEFLPQSDVAELVKWADVIKERDDAQAGKRQAPARAVFDTEIKRLDPDGAPGLNDVDVLKVVSNTEMVRMAAMATKAPPKMLLECLAAAEVLFENGFIPWGFYVDFEKMIGTTDANERKGVAEKIKQDYQSNIPAYLRSGLFEAVDRYSTIT